MEELLKKINNPEYSANLQNNTMKIKEEIIKYENKIKDLKSKLKLGEIKLNRKNKGPSIKETELKRIAYDYNSKKYEYNSLNDRVEQNKKIEKKMMIK